MKIYAFCGNIIETIDQCHNSQRWPVISPNCLRSSFLRLNFGWSLRGVWVYKILAMTVWTSMVVIPSRTPTAIAMVRESSFGSWSRRICVRIGGIAWLHYTLRNVLKWLRIRLDVALKSRHWAKNLKNVGREECSLDVMLNCSTSIRYLGFESDRQVTIIKQIGIATDDWLPSCVQKLLFGSLPSLSRLNTETCVRSHIARR